MATAQVQIYQFLSVEDKTRRHLLFDKKEEDICSSSTTRVYLLPPHAHNLPSRAVCTRIVRNIESKVFPAEHAGTDYSEIQSPSLYPMLLPRLKQQCGKGLAFHISCWVSGFQGPLGGETDLPGRA
jgi:hypothetical protein